jgi:hypothetical protein
MNSFTDLLALVVNALFATVILTLDLLAEAEAPLGAPDDDAELPAAGRPLTSTLSDADPFVAPLLWTTAGPDDEDEALIGC